MARNNRFETSIDSAIENTRDILAVVTDTDFESGGEKRKKTITQVTDNNNPDSSASVVHQDRVDVAPPTGNGALDDLLRLVTVPSQKGRKSVISSINFEYDVYEALDKLAEKTRKSRSRLVNELLRPLIVRK